MEMPGSQRDRRTTGCSSLAFSQPHSLSRQDRGGSLRGEKKRKKDKVVWAYSKDDGKLSKISRFCVKKIQLGCCRGALGRGKLRTGKLENSRPTVSL